MFSAVKSGQQSRGLKSDASEAGHLDGIFSDELTGWFVAPTDADAKLVLVVDGQVHAGTEPFVCDVAREDVAKLLGVEENCGFCLPISGLPANKVYDVSVLHRESGFDFKAKSFLYCPAVIDNAEVLSRLFHAEFYRFKYALENLSNFEALDHYMRFGIFENLDPNPWFSSVHVAEQMSSLGIEHPIAIVAYLAHEADKLINPSPRFDISFYANENPDVIQAFGYLEHYVLHGHAESRARFPNRLPDNVLNELNELSAIENDLEHAVDFVERVVGYPDLSASTYLPSLFKRRFPESPAAVVCVNSLTLGGAELIATYLMKSLVENYGSENVLMIVTDSGDLSLATLLGEDTNVIYLDEQGRVPGAAERIDLLHAVIGQLCPERIFNINSRTAWGMYHSYGKQLSRFVELNANLFCLDYDSKGRVFGYVREYIPGCHKYLTHVMCDNQQIITDIAEHYGFTETDMAKFQTVYVPAADGVAAIDDDRQAATDKPILWSGRLANQKRPELLIAIAESMPDKQFVVYGPVGDSESCNRILNNEIANIDYRGVYSSVADVDFSEFDFYLNTSAWEGLPTMIIQMMSAGLPVVTPIVGGIGELVDDETGWVVTPGDDVSAYTHAIRELISQPAVAKQRAKQAKLIVNERHTWKQYVQRLKQINVLKKRKIRLPKNVFKFTRKLFQRAS